MTYADLIAEVRRGTDAALARMGAPETGYAVEPARPGFGDVTCNAAFLLAKSMKRSPQDIAAEICRLYMEEGSPMVESAEAHPSGYANFAARPGPLAERTVLASLAGGYGAPDVGQGQRVAVEHTSVNPNKALHIGHVRNIVIGDTVSRILRRSGHDVSVLNYVDDSGAQVADIVLAVTQLGFAREPPEGTKLDHYYGDTVYVRATEEHERRPELKQERQRILREIEEGTSEDARLAAELTRGILAAQLETCWSLSVYYDCINYESQIVRSGMWDSAFGRLKESGAIRLETEGDGAGCWVFDVKGENDKVIVRSDGTATYVAKDIPYAAWKLGLVDDPFGYSEYAVQPDGRRLWETVLEGGQKMGFAAPRAITVIDSRQSGLQRIITSLVDRSAPEPGAYRHLAYESVALSPGTAAELGVSTAKKQEQMSGRKGIYVGADEVLAMLVSRAAEETRKRNPDMAEEGVLGIARTVAVGTLRYEMIKPDLDKMIVFDLKKSLSLEGDTAPYIQYTYARASRIVEKAGKMPDPQGADYGLLDGKHERALVRRIGLLEHAVADSARNLSPKIVARYCRDLAVAFNSFYEHAKVMDPSDPARTAARLCLVASFRATLENSLSLLGIGAPDRM